MTDIDEEEDVAMDTTPGADEGDYVGALNKAEEDVARSFDKTLTTLSAGALAISITYMKEIAPHPSCTEWLAGAWTAFGIALLTILFGFLLAQIALKRAAHLYAQNVSADVSLRSRACWNTGILTLNASALIAFVVGVVSLVVFAASNLPSNTTRAVVTTETLRLQGEEKLEITVTKGELNVRRWKVENK